MIPHEDLKNIKPLPDTVKRERLIKGKRHPAVRKLQSRRFRSKSGGRDHIGMGHR